MKKDGKNKGIGKIDLTTIILFVVLLVIAIAFFFMLNKDQGTGFGIGEILFAFVFALFVTALLAWCKSLIVNNPYLGAGIGIIGIVSLGYGFSLRYAGTKSTIFLIVTGILTLIYLGFNFFKYMERDKPNPKEFDDEDE